jgi:hypothetical protein
VEPPPPLPVSSPPRLWCREWCASTRPSFEDGPIYGLSRNFPGSTLPEVQTSRSDVLRSCAHGQRTGKCALRWSFLDIVRKRRFDRKCHSAELNGLINDLKMASE